jgi:geranylgeranyl pyrophosphate synthase
MATFAGGHLFARAMQVFASAGDAINRTVCEAIEEIWRGQTRETQNAYRLDVDERAYLDTIASKTATLYELACRIGAVLGRLSQPQADTLATYGRDVGIGFQLIDDVLDVVGDERALGKPHASDIRGGIYTLPVIHALSQKNERAQQLGAILSRRDPPPDLLDEAIAIVRSNGAITYSLRTATAILERARDRLDGFPPSDAAQALRKLPGDILRSVSDQA